MDIQKFLPLRRTRRSAVDAGESAGEGKHRTVIDRRESAHKELLTDLTEKKGDQR
jgi:hypothetical protein